MDMTIEEATAKQAGIKQKITALKAKIKAAQAKLNQHDKKMRQMADKKNKIKEELLNIQKKVCCITCWKVIFDSIESCNKVGKALYVPIKYITKIVDNFCFFLLLYKLNNIL